MPCIKSLLLASLRYANLLSLATVDDAPPTAPVAVPTPVTTAAPADDEFGLLLSSIPDASLHSALHAHLPSRFRDGMFERDSAAVRALHSSDPALATRLVAAARYDLLRRQNGNLTVSTPPPTVTTTPAPTKSLVTTTNAQGQTVVATITPGGGIVDSIVLETTTLPNGQLSTYTSYVSPQSTGGGTPHLQSAAPERSFVKLSGILLVAVAFGALLL